MQEEHISPTDTTAISFLYLKKIHLLKANTTTSSLLPLSVKEMPSAPLYFSLPIKKWVK